MWKKMTGLVLLLSAMAVYSAQRKELSIPDSQSGTDVHKDAAENDTNHPLIHNTTISPTENASSTKNLQSATLPQFTQQHSASDQHIKASQRAVARDSYNAYAHFQMGNYEGAVRQLRAMMKQYPKDELIRKNLGTSLLALGIFKMQKKELVDAESALDEAGKLGNVNARKALAELKIKQGQIDNAADILEEFSGVGVDPETLRVLIDLALSQDNVERAEELLNRLSETLARQAAATHQPVSPELLEFVHLRRQRLEQKKNFLKTQETVARQGIEVSFSSPDLRPIADVVAKAIDDVQSELIQLLGPLPPHARMRAWLVPANNFRDFTGAPAWAAAVFDGYIRIPVERMGLRRHYPNEFFGKLARHEATHAYLYAFCGENIPSWIGEGLAQIFEGRSQSQSKTEIEKNGRRAMSIVEAEIERPFTQVPSELVNRLYARSHLLIQAMSKEGGGVASTWQRVLAANCLQSRPLSDVLSEQFSAASPTELWKKYFTSTE